jgi:hypothetical protein
MGEPCPQCGKRMMLDFATSQIKCFSCGYVRPDEISQLGETARQVKEQGAPVAVQFSYAGEVAPYALTAFESGQYALHDGDRAKAFDYFMQAAEIQPDFIDAHLWAAKCTDDPVRKRSLVGDVLVAMPNHLEALRMLMIIDGKLTPEEAARTYHHDDQRVQTTLDAVETKTQALLCPNCGGDLAQNGDHVDCRFCGYHALTTAYYANQALYQRDPGGRGEGNALTMALLKRKAQPVRWNVGKRVVECNQCGAMHTVTTQMSQRCRFCGSTNVILSDALDSFEQPESLIPFKVSRELALENIQKKLSSLTERFMSFFDSNKVTHGTIDGVYLPHWVFDTTIDVTRVRSKNMIELDRSTSTEMVDDITVCAVKSPPRPLIGSLGGWDLDSRVAYEPKWLATYPAQIASIEFDAASLDARAFASQVVKQRQDSTIDDFVQNSMSRERETITTQLYTNVRDMSFALTLLPVWVALMVEADGDLRMAVVNGQTGKVALGKSQKPERR